nr:MAG TPA: hypothetical protein [Caudoviricetes sp.]
MGCILSLGVSGSLPLSRLQKQVILRDCIM